MLGVDTINSNRKLYRPIGEYCLCCSLSDIKNYMFAVKQKYLETLKRIEFLSTLQLLWHLCHLLL